MEVEHRSNRITLCKREIRIHRESMSHVEVMLQLHQCEHELRDHTENKLKWNEILEIEQKTDQSKWDFIRSAVEQTAIPKTFAARWIDFDVVIRIKRNS